MADVNEFQKRLTKMNHEGLRRQKMGSRSRFHGQSPTFNKGAATKESIKAKMGRSSRRAAGGNFGRVTQQAA